METESERAWTIFSSNVWEAEMLQIPVTEARAKHPLSIAKDCEEIDLSLSPEG